MGPFLFRHSQLTQFQIKQLEKKYNNWYNNILKCVPHFSMQEWSYNETKVVEEH